MSTAYSLNFTLFDFERLCMQGDYAQAEQCMAEILVYWDQRLPLESQFARNAEQILIKRHQGLAPLSNQLTREENEQYYSRLASAITLLLSDASYQPSDDTLVKLIVYKNALSNVFYVSCYNNMDHILFNRGLMSADYSLILKTELDIKLLYSCITFNTDIKYSIPLLVDALPAWGQYWYFGMIYNYYHPFNERVEEQHRQHFEHHHLIRDMPLDTNSLSLSISPWMLCSYLDRTDRHDMKESINVAIERWTDNELKTHIPERKGITPNTGEIKKVLVMSEQYTSRHAMYRCYHPEMTALKQSYHLTLMSDPRAYDEVSALDFHNIIDINDSITDFANIAKQIVAYEPDLIFFPSLGTAKWTIPFANCRLAPYQAMAYGHPASAHSKHIDYSFLIPSMKDRSIKLQAFCQETIIPLDFGDNWSVAPHPEYHEGMSKIVKPDDKIVRLAINSSLPKITPRFLALCDQAIATCQAEIELHFFVSLGQLGFDKAMASRFGERAVVHDFECYEDYMHNLAQCDLALGTFPFGGSNTNIDIMLLGIPKLYYSELSGIASVTDKLILQGCDLPAILKPKSEQELLVNLITLIEDHEARERISQQIKAMDPYNFFFNNAPVHELENSASLAAGIRWMEGNGNKAS